MNTTKGAKHVCRVGAGEGIIFMTSDLTRSDDEIMHVKENDIIIPINHDGHLTLIVHQSGVVGYLNGDYEELTP